MTADAENLLLENDLKTRMTTVEEHLGNSLIATSGVNARLDRLNDKVERIERRLNIPEAM